MTIGPVEYIIVGFPGTSSTGDRPELVNSGRIGHGPDPRPDLHRQGCRRSVVAFEIDELDAAAGFGGLDADVGGLISPEDIEYAPRHSNRTLRLRC